MQRDGKADIHLSNNILGGGVRSIVKVHTVHTLRAKRNVILDGNSELSMRI
jgi:hypothetical protein